MLYKEKINEEVTQKEIDELCEQLQLIVNDPNLVIIEEHIIYDISFVKD